MKKPKYPESRTVEQVDVHHGVEVTDPYRWLEDPNSPETKAWVEAQNELTHGYLEDIPIRSALQKRLTELWDYPKQTVPAKKGGRYFNFRNTGLQNQNVLYVQTQLEGEARILLDPNTLSEDGTVALGVCMVSPNGKYLAYSLSGSGSDWQTWRVREVETGQDLPDVLEWSKFSTAAWLPDGSGFFYSRYDAPEEEASYTGANYFHKVYLHKLGTPQAEDRLIYECPDEKEWGFTPEVTHDGKYLTLRVWKGTLQENLFFYRELGSDGPFIELIPEFEADFSFVGNQGSRFFLRTNWKAERSQIVAIDIENPARENWQTVVPQGEDNLEHALIAQQSFVLLYSHHAHHALRLFSLAGEPQGELELPGIGSVFDLSGEPDDPELFYGFTSFLTPNSVYYYSFESSSSRNLFTPPTPFDATAYETHQVFATSKDGTQVPLFLVHKKGLKLDGQNPTLLYGYGGFNISMTPAFSPGRLVWLEHGGVYAQAVLRGGGEYGEAWYKAGTLERKQNVFDDFIACAEYLIEQKYTHPKRLAIQGGSNGGLLVGACMTQRPDLFGVTLPAVGVMDMLRFHKFTIGWAWVSDYGSPEDLEQFKNLRAYSPLHNIKPGVSYPATLVTTGDHDDRVVPAHSFKFAAALQAAQSGAAPTMIRIQTKAGHGAGKPTKMLIEEQADIYAFTLKQMEQD